MKLLPLKDRVIIKPDEVPDKKGSIIIPDCAKRVPEKGLIVAMGKGRRSKKGDIVPITDYKVGDRVLYARWTGTEVMTGEVNHIIISHDNIMGLVEEE